jgi:hypothetical protein
VSLTRATAVIKDATLTLATVKLPPNPVYAKGINSAFPPILSDTITRQSVFPGKDGNPIYWDSTELAAIKSGAKKLFLFGRIDYVDTMSFFGSHSTGYCFEFNPTPATKIDLFLSCYEPAYTYAN